MVVYVDRVCITCGKQFSIPKSQIKTPNSGKCCSAKCRSTSQRNRVVRICKTCGVQFEMKVSDLNYGRGDYCSKPCFNLAQTVYADITCPVCGNNFRPVKEKKYCCKACATIGTRDRVVKHCSVCGQSFERSRIHSQSSKYCSRKCSGIGRSGVNSPLWNGGHNWFRGKNWGRQRDLARKRDGGICQICHARPKRGQRKFGIHHITPYRLFDGDYITANDLSNLVTLCPSCHKKADLGRLAVPKPLF